MERLQTSRRRTVKGAVLLSLALLAGCTETAPEIPATNATILDILGVPETETVRHGEVHILKPTTDALRRGGLVAGITLVDHVYPHGMEDGDAPAVGRSPVRLNTQVTLHGKGSNVLDDDLACDVVNLDLSSFPDKGQVYIAALALSDDGNNRAMISWPDNTNGEIGDRAYLCFPVSNEPHEGAILALSVTPRQG